MQSVLGIPVENRLIQRWRDWFAPAIQAFATEHLDDENELPERRGFDPSPEVCDTFQVYGGNWIWLDQSEFAALPLKVRRALIRGREATGRIRDLPAGLQNVIGDGRIDSRVIWWPSILQSVGDQPVFDFVEEGLRRSRHAEVPDSTWTRARPVLPDATALAGTFPDASGPNCFGTVMAAAGVSGAAEQWMFQEPFESWLTESGCAVRGTHLDTDPGTVFVWRDHDGLATHAAVTIGDGYALSKPSQAWCSPRIVWTVRETIAAARDRGQRLRRYRLAAV